MPGRIPDALKHVFMASQAGIDVDTINAPTDGAGFKMFNTRNIRHYHHTVVAHQKIPRAPRESSLERERRMDGNSSVVSSTSSTSRTTQLSTASQATRKEIGSRTGGASARAKKIEAGSPQSFLNKELKRRGYNLKSYATLDSAYYSHPNEHQLASYGRIVTKAMYQPNNTSVLEKLLQSGISPNACNKFGESIVHLVCRRGHMSLLTMLMDSGCSIKVSDDYGRTPLHDACWQSRPNFDVIRIILETDKHLVRMRDIRGTTPLSYVKPENYEKWNCFLASIMDQFWPKRNADFDGPELPPPLTLKQPNSLPLRVPRTALSLDQIGMVATGEMDVDEALYIASMVDETDSSSGEEDDDGDGDDSSFYDSDDSSFYDSDDDSFDDFDDGELEDICMIAGKNLDTMKEYCVR